MKNDRSKISIADEHNAIVTDPLFAVDQIADSDDTDDIDRLLRAVADESNAMIDFESIKQRVIESAMLKKNNRSRFRKAAGFALLSCASLLMVFALVNVIGSAKRSEVPPDAYAYSDVNPANYDSTCEPVVTPKKMPYRGSSGDRAPRWILNFGEVSAKISENITDSISSVLSELLSENSVNILGQNDACLSAVGTDNDGSAFCCELAAYAEPPIELEVGEACSVKEGSCFTYYWQFSDGRCLSIRITGYEQSKADSIFRSIAQRIAKADSPNGTR